MKLDELRLQSANILCLGTVIFAGFVVICEWWLQGSLGLASIVAVPAAVVLTLMFLLQRGSQSFRYTVVSVLMAEVMALVIAARGHPWQIDMHLGFFGGLAVCALMYDVRAIILATVLVAIHHIGLGLTLETLIFYDGGGLPRILLHAGILVAEGGGLVGMVLTTQALLGVAADKTVEAAREAEKVTAMAAATEAERNERAETHERMLGRLEQSFGKVMISAAAGEFSERVETDFKEEVFNNLARSVNAVIETVDRGITETGTVLSAMARTDLTRRVEGQYQGAFDRLKADTNAVAERLTEIVVNLQTTSKGLKVATTEIAGGASDLSDRTSKQAATIEQTSAAMEELAAVVQKNAQRARDAAVNAGHVTETAEQGGAVMHQATEAMERITTSSAKISNIIGLIDDIAFQTNLLALNASVEAARAGEAGKGFAVVAVEVRRLAQSAAEASKEIKVLIDQSVGEVRSGSNLVEQAASRLTAMLDAARANNLLLESIAKDSREQAASIEEVNTSVRQLDEMTQHNASLVEQTNAAIAQTDLQAGELDKVVGLFSIGTAPVAAPVRRTARVGRELPAPAKPAGAPPAAGGIKGLQARVRTAAKAYLGKGGAATAEDWSEF